VLCYGLACLSKEYSLILPALLLLYHYVFKKEVKAHKFIPLLSVTLVYVILRAMSKFSLSGTEVHTTFFHRLPGFFAAITNYVRLMLFPFGLHMEYGTPIFRLLDPMAISGFVILCGLLFYALRQLRGDALLSFSILWFIVGILPVSNLYPINAYMAEHWLYLPSLGFFWIISKALETLCKNSRNSGIIITACLIAYYGGLTVKQNLYWKDPKTFYEATLRYTPNNERIYINLGNAYLKADNHGEALKAYKRAIELNPRSAGAYNDLGNLYLKLKNSEEAIAAYKKTLELDPKFASAYNNLGAIYYDMKRQDDAINVLQKAISLDPNIADAYNNLGNSYSALGEREKAIKAYRKAIEINPNFASAYNNLGTELQEKNEAIKMYKKAIEINPQYAEAYYNLSKAYEGLGKDEEASQAYRRAKKLDPDIP
jgi:tetratricopeptide (TPR) repeat protein